MNRIWDDDDDDDFLSINLDLLVLSLPTITTSTNNNHDQINHPEQQYQVQPSINNINQQCNSFCSDSKPHYNEHDVINQCNQHQDISILSPFSLSQYQIDTFCNNIQSNSDYLYRLIRSNDISSLSNAILSYTTKYNNQLPFSNDGFIYDETIHTDSTTHLSSIHHIPIHPTHSTSSQKGNKSVKTNTNIINHQHSIKPSHPISLLTASLVLHNYDAFDIILNYIIKKYLNLNTSFLYELIDIDFLPFHNYLLSNDLCHLFHLPSYLPSTQIPQLSSTTITNQFQHSLINIKLIHIMDHYSLKNNNNIQHNPNQTIIIPTHPSNKNSIIKLLSQQLESTLFSISHNDHYNRNQMSINNNDHYASMSTTVPLQSHDLFPIIDLLQYYLNLPTQSIPFQQHYYITTIINNTNNNTTPNQSHPSKQSLFSFWVDFHTTSQQQYQSLTPTTTNSKPNTKSTTTIKSTQQPLQPYQYPFQRRIAIDIQSWLSKYCKIDQQYNHRIYWYELLTQCPLGLSFYIINQIECQLPPSTVHQTIFYWAINHQQPKYSLFIYLSFIYKLLIDMKQHNIVLSPDWFFESGISYGFLITSINLYQLLLFENDIIQHNQIQFEINNKMYNSIYDYISQKNINNKNSNNGDSVKRLDQINTNMDIEKKDKEKKVKKDKKSDKNDSSKSDKKSSKESHKSDKKSKKDHKGDKVKSGDECRITNSISQTTSQSNQQTNLQLEPTITPTLFSFPSTPHIATIQSTTSSTQQQRLSHLKSHLEYHNNNHMYNNNTLFNFNSQSEHTSQDSTTHHSHSLHTPHPLHFSDSINLSTFQLLFQNIFILFPPSIQNHFISTILTSSPSKITNNTDSFSSSLTFIPQLLPFPITNPTLLFNWITSLDYTPDSTRNPQFNSNIIFNQHLLPNLSIVLSPPSLSKKLSFFQHMTEHEHINLIHNIGFTNQLQLQHIIWLSSLFEHNLDLLWSQHLITPTIAERLFTRVIDLIPFMLSFESNDYILDSDNDIIIDEFMKGNTISTHSHSTPSPHYNTILGTLMMDQIYHQSDTKNNYNNNNSHNNFNHNNHYHDIIQYTSYINHLYFQPPNNMNQYLGPIFNMNQNKNNNNNNNNNTQPNSFSSYSFLTPNLFHTQHNTEYDIQHTNNPNIPKQHGHNVTNTTTTINSHSIILNPHLIQDSLGYLRTIFTHIISILYHLIPYLQPATIVKILLDDERPRNVTYYQLLTYILSNIPTTHFRKHDWDKQFISRNFFHHGDDLKQTIQTIVIHVIQLLFNNKISNALVSTSKVSLLSSPTIPNLSSTTTSTTLIKSNDQTTFKSNSIIQRDQLCTSFKKLKRSFIYPEKELMLLIINIPFQQGTMKQIVNQFPALFGKYPDVLKLFS